MMDSVDNTDKNDTARDSFQCEICDKVFGKRYYLYKHYRRLHKVEPTVQKTLFCPIPNCENKILNNDELRKHVESHGIPIETETLLFQSMEHFEKWKDEIQANNNASYLLKKISNMADGTIKRYFWCNRSGSTFPSKSKMERAPRAKGSCKINAHCPSTIELIEQKDDVKVVYHKTHVGHDLELKYIPLSNSTKEAFASKIADGIPLERCLEDVKSSVSETFNKVHCVTKKDLRNIGTSFNLFNSERLHSNDATSVDLWVKEMNEMGDNSPVLVYKPQGERFANLEDKDFCLVIMTVAQKEMLLKFGHEKICIDSTHGTNPYDFLLTTLLVVDDFGAGFPVGFCISNTTTARQMEIFFRAIFEKTRIFTPEVFMSDDAAAFFNAWRDVMGEPKKQLLCVWHVDKSWKQGLLKIKNVAKRNEVYKYLRLLLEELDVEKFYKLLERFLHDLKSDEETENFYKYFKVHYANRCPLWAYCHRRNSSINTNMYLEAFHKVLKYKYMGGTKCPRLDICISLLLKIVRDLTFTRFQKLVIGANCGKIADINSRHRQSINISNEKISESDSNSWNVESEGNKDIKYVVRKESLCEGCNLICNYCKICIHSYICSCIDSQVKLNMCKHIHAVHRYNSNEEVVRKVSEKKIISEIEESNSFHNLVFENQRSNDNIMKLKVNQMTHLLDNNNLNDEAKQKNMKHIDAIIELASNKNSFDHNKNKEPVNKKIDVQKRFFSTKRKRPPTQNSSIKKPSSNYKIAVKESIENDDDILNVHDAFDHIY